jgi:hypothetical protein
LWIFRGAAFLVVLAISWLARATEPRATLEYVRQGRAAEECPDEATFRALVAAKLGYDPFGGGAPSSLRVVFRRAGADLSGNLTLGSGGGVRGERTIRAAAGECDELAASLALAAAVAVDPDSVAQRATPQAVEPAPAAPAPPPAPPESSPPAAQAKQEPVRRAEPAASEEMHATIGPRWSAGMFVPWGLTPGVTAGVRAGVGLDGDAWLVGLEGSATLESTKASDAGTVTARSFDAALVAGFRATLTKNVALALCVAGRLGVLRSDAEDVSRASPQSDLIASVGPRAGVELFPWRAVGFGAELEAPIALSRVHLLIDDHGQPREVWASSRVGMMAAVTVIFRPR